jgi:acetyl-CoA synthetase
LVLGKLLVGYRGKPPADMDALIGTIMNVARYASSNLATLVEIDVNPVIVRPVGLGAVAVDTMIRLQHFP